MAQVKLSEFIICEVKGFKTCRFKIGRDLMGLTAISNLNSHVNMGGTGIGLQNLEARLRLAFGSQAEFTLRASGEWTLAEIHLIGSKA